MTIEKILLIYFIVTLSVLGITAILAFNTKDGTFNTKDGIPEIDNFYDWLFYGIFWVLILIKYMLKFLFKLFQR